MTQQEENNALPEQPTSKAHLLNDSQRRSLTITLRRVELAVWHLEEQLTRQNQPQLILTRYVNQPDERQRQALLYLIQLVRQEVATLVAEYQLAAANHDVTRNLMAEFTLLWCDLEDVRPKKLTRYGPVAPQAQHYLDPPLQHLIQLVLTIDAVGNGTFSPERVLGLPTT